jgi:hypothetical protein
VRIRVLAAAIALGLLTGCVQPPTTSPSPSLSEVSVDLTEPGHARIMVRRLIAKAGSRDLIQVEITKDWAAITVVKNNQAETWAWRDNTIKQVQSDVAYVQQKIFNIEDFNINDVGALFRSAAQRWRSASSRISAPGWIFRAAPRPRSGGCAPRRFRSPSTSARSGLISRFSGYPGCTLRPSGRCWTRRACEAISTATRVGR